MDMVMDMVRDRVIDRDRRWALAMADPNRQNQ